MRISKLLANLLKARGLELYREGHGPDDPIYLRRDGLPLGHAYKCYDGWEVYAAKKNRVFNVQLGVGPRFPTLDTAIIAILEAAGEE